MIEKKETIDDEDLDELLDKQWEMQDQINKSCKMKEKSKIFKE